MIQGAGLKDKGKKCSLIASDNILMFFCCNSTGKAACSTLSRLVSSAHSDILLKSGLLLREIAERMKIELIRSMEEFIINKPEKTGVS